MLPDPFNAPVDIAGGTQITNPFTLIGLGSNQSDRRDVTAAAGEPSVLKVSHSTVGKGATLRNRHLARIEAYPIVDSVEDKSAQPLALYAVADVPANGFTSDQVTALYRQFCGLLRGCGGDSANQANATVFFDRWLAGEL